MSTKDAVIHHLRTQGACSGAEIASALGVSRQAINRWLRELVDQGVVYKIGETRGTRYHLVGSDDETVRASGYRRTLELAGLEEDAVFREIDIVLNLASKLQRNAFTITRYAFTEVLNNAIDHSESETCTIDVRLSEYTIEFVIRDFGVGIFARLREYYDLPDEYDALRELLKGKRTIAPDKHTGEGLFFTSRVGDTVSIRSHAIALSFLNDRDDLETGEIPWMEGTEVSFSISRRTRRRLQDAFDKFAGDEYDYTFGESRVRVRLYQREYVSRSEGRRLVFGLDEFKRVVLDFSGVSAIQQGFADEIFRVFQSTHPETRLEVEEANPAILQMIRHVSGDADGLRIS